MNGSASFCASPIAVEKSSIANRCWRLALIEQAAVVIGLRVVGPDRDRLVEIVERVERLLLLPVDDAAADIGGRVVRIERQRLVVVGEREIELAGLAVDQRAVGVGLGVVRIEADRLVEVGERLLIAAGLAEHRAAHVVGLRVVRIALHDAGQRRDVGGEAASWLSSVSDVAAVER